MTKIIVSFTSIPPRFAYLSKVIAGLQAQTLRPDGIELYLPESYRREEFNTAEAPQLPSSLDGCEVVRIAQDFGPATKVLPAAQRYKGQDVRIVYCDDDKIYDPHWLEGLASASQDHPDCVIAHNGQPSRRLEAKARWQSKGWDYRALRLASLGRWKPIKSRASYVPDIAEGFGGVLIRPEFVDDAAYDIPDILWTVDDVWLSGIFQKNGHRLKVVTPETPLQNQEIAHEGKTLGRHHSLFEMVHQEHDRIQANAACIRHMRKAFGVYG